MTMRRNDAPRAADLYEAFHRFEPRRIGTFASGFKIPSSMHAQGRSINVLYRSDKVDPSTLRRPRRPVDYIHEHKPGVRTYLARGAGELVQVPAYLRDADQLTLLGECLGFSFEGRDGAEVEAVGKGKLPELYATPNGRALLVVQDKRQVLAAMWGGKLNVEPRGIVG